MRGINVPSPGSWDHIQIQDFCHPVKSYSSPMKTNTSHNNIV